MDKSFLARPVGTLFAGSGEPSYTVQNSSESANYSVSLPDSTLSTTLDSGGTTSHSGYYGYYWPYYEPYKEFHYHHWNYYPSHDHFETAFKLARKLMDKKLTKPLKTIEDFFRLMDAIVEVLQ